MMLLAIFDWPHWAVDLGAPGRIRTRDPLLRRQLLYPTELQAPTDDCAGSRTRRGHVHGTAVIKVKAGAGPHAPRPRTSASTTWSPVTTATASATPRSCSISR